MGLDYWFVHFKWTIPPAVLTTAIYWPFFTRLEIQKISILVVLAVLAALPWDSYLVRHNVWYYPSNAVAGSTILYVPLEEVFFFIIQTYNTGLLYVILTKRLVLPTYLGRCQGSYLPIIGTLAIPGMFLTAAIFLSIGDRFSYLSLITLWICPFLMLQWTMSCRFLLALPRREILLAIGIPSFYLCAVDSIELRRGTWVIADNTKLDVRVWGSLELEEAIFFFVTNIMIVFGLVAIDHAIAISEHFMATSPVTMNSTISLHTSLRLYFTYKPEDLDASFIEGLTKAVENVSNKSQSMYMGSVMFQGLLRIDLLSLYNFCRIMDDLVDEAPNASSASSVIQLCSQALKSHFNSSSTDLDSRVRNISFKPAEKNIEGSDDPIRLLLYSAINLLPISRLVLEPFLDLLCGFETDLKFSAGENLFPISTEEDLDAYAYNVASTVATLMVELVFRHYPPVLFQTTEKRCQILKAAQKMGQALQYVNIARDVEHDAAIGRVYIPSSWLREEGLTPAGVLTGPNQPGIKKLRHRILDKADALHGESLGAIDDLPREVRAPIRTVVESYMMIGKVVRKLPDEVRNKTPNGKLKLSLLRRLVVAWQAAYTA